MNELKTELLQIRVKEETLKQIDRLQVLTKAASRSDAVRRSFDITEMIINEIIKGGSVILADSKGKKRQVLITGLNYE